MTTENYYMTDEEITAYWKRREAKSATDRHGNKIRVGDSIRYLGYGEVRLYDQPRPVVKVVAIYKQGKDGTILHTDQDLNPDSPYNKQCVARQSERVA